MSSSHELTSEVKAAGAHTRNLIHRARKLPLVEKECNPLDLPTASPGWLVKLDKETGTILGYVEVAEKWGLHFVEATPAGEPMTAVANHVRWYRT